jgi:putative ABC transport system substrate-binding protein
MQFDRLKRRDFITLIGGAAAWPMAARAQEPMRRIGILRGDAETDVIGRRNIGVFRERLGELGWTQGRNITIDYRWAAGDARRVRDYAAELVGLKPDVILSFAPATTAALQHETRTIPIVFTGVADPVRAGFVASLAAPGGNVTGFTNFEFTMGAKWLEFLKQIAPSVSRVMVIRNPANPTGPGYVRAIEAAAPQLAMQITDEPVPDTLDYERVVACSSPAPVLSRMDLHGGAGPRSHGTAHAPGPDQSACPLISERVRTRRRARARPLSGPFRTTYARYEVFSV